MRSAASVRGASIAIALPAYLVSSPRATAQCVPLTADLDVTADVVICPGSYPQWHATSDIRPLLSEVFALPGWNPGGPVAIDVQNDGSTGHRRIRAFERDPRTSPHDFPEIGAVPFVPFLNAPVVII